ncbi:MAG: GNAT family N-acetyltransferase [Bacteroidetes bacterium]|jgi:GNAT superfamily N-acetyltransferase|nr:GNAT family N-acetyltransferase [Bacteroidota bacterium]
MLIRKGKTEDVPAALQLIKELAEFEKAPEQVINTEAKMLEDGFGKNPVYRMLVAESEGKVIGIAIYFLKYSTWKGKGIYLDDIVVNENFRGQGTGMKLFEAVRKEAIEEGCRQLHWQVLDWNERAIDFYKKFNAEFDAEWINCKLHFN